MEGLKSYSFSHKALSLDNNSSERTRIIPVTHVIRTLCNDQSSISLAADFQITSGRFFEY